MVEIMLKRIFSGLITLAIAQSVFSSEATDLTGEWKVIDDKSGFTLVKVQITEPRPHLYQGHIVEAFNPPNQPAQDLSKMKGFHLLKDMKQDIKDPYQMTSGFVTDPVINQQYQIKGKLSKRGNMMILRSPSDSDKSSRKLSWVRIR